MKSSSSIPPPRWTREELLAGQQKATVLFRKERLEEPLEDYLDAFEEYQGKVEELLEVTVDLTTLEENALAILKDTKLQEAFRYLAGPPISFDDLKTLTDAPSLSPKQLQSDPSLVRRVVKTVRQVLDRRRFPWVSEGREPSEGEKHAAVLASAALLAASRVATSRRNLGKTAQEELVKTALRAKGIQEVDPRPITKLAEAPQPGEFCGECMFGTRKADIVVGLLDGRSMPIECKVSNSQTNSIKRLNNDAAAKAERWMEEHGKLHVVPTAVLSGVYNLRHLEAAQEHGLTLFWAHDLDQLMSWIKSTWPPADDVGEGGVAERRAGGERARAAGPGGRRASGSGVRARRTKGR